MKALISTLLLAVSTAMMSLSVTAAPNYHSHTHHDTRSYHQQYKADRHHQYRQAKPTRDWRVGATVPHYYQSRQYLVDYRYHRLAKPNKNQQWLRVNGDYVLVNVKNQKIVRMLRG